MDFDFGQQSRDERRSRCQREHRKAERHLPHTKARINNNPPPTSKATAITQPRGARGKPTLLM